MNMLLERVGAFSARRWWIVIIGWVIILGGLLAAHHATNGEYVNNYTVAGTSSAIGKDTLSSSFPQQSGYAGQIVFHAKSGTVAAQQTAVNQSVTNVSKLPHVIKAVSPFASANSGLVSKDGTIAYSNVSWSVNPNSLDTTYLDQLNKAVAPARDAGLQIAYGAGAGQIGQASHDLTSEIIGLACALVLLLFMFGSLIAAAIPLVSAIFSVLAGLSLLGRAGLGDDVPDHGPDHRHPARPGRRGRLRPVPGGPAPGTAGHRHGRGHLGGPLGRDLGRGHRGRGRHGGGVHPRPVRVRGRVRRVARPGRGHRGRADHAGRADPGARVHGRGPDQRARRCSARFRARRAGLSAQEQAAQTAAATDDKHEHSAFARWGKKVSDRPWPWAIASVLILVVLSIPLFSITLGQPDNGTNPTSESNRQAYDLISQGFGVGVNGPLVVVVKLPKESSQQTQQLLSTMQQNVKSTPGWPRSARRRSTRPGRSPRST